MRCIFVIRIYGLLGQLDLENPVSDVLEFNPRLPLQILEMDPHMTWKCDTINATVSQNQHPRCSWI